MNRPSTKKHYYVGYTKDLETYCDKLEIAINRLMDLVDSYTKDCPLEKLSREEWLEALMEDDND